MERTSSRKTCQKAQPSVEENGLLNGYDDDDDEDSEMFSLFREFFISELFAVLEFVSEYLIKGIGLQTFTCT